ncbi:ComEC/Rec2 family competence protein [Streptomyces abyssalis]|uniref:ComEC/Rec2 family competence protein n=2 Tax=Streptomyces abyssalis TaxID=933944 RepID=UPI003D67CF8C
MSAWAAAALASGVSGRVAATGAAACVLGAVLLLAGARAGEVRAGGARGGEARDARQRVGEAPDSTRQRVREGPGAAWPRGARPGGAWQGGRPPGRLTAAAALLCAAAAAGAAALHAADLRRGPLPRLAEQHATATVDLTVTGDPHRIRPSVNGAQQRPGALLFRAEATRVTARASPGPTAGEAGSGDRGGGGPRHVDRAVRTPVLVIVQQRDGPPPGRWHRLLPSTGLRAEARLAAPLRTGYGQDVAAVVRLRADGPPPVVRGPTSLQRGAGSLRAGLREATDGLDGDARGLLPGLVVGDTSRLRPDLEEAFRATDMTHLLAVSGANLTIMLAVLIGPPGTAHLAERRGLAPRLGIPLRGTAVLGALLTLAFVVVCRPEPSVIRAAACGLITLLALVTGRRRSLLPALAAAVLLLVLHDPGLAVDFGFLLSVVATGALLTLAPRWSAALRRRGMNGRLAEALAAAAAAQVVCAPVVVVLASHVSLVAVPCNLLAEFAVAPATVLGFAALAAAPFAMPLAEALAWLAGWPTEAIAALARTGAALPGGEIAWPGGWTGALLLAVLTAAALLLCRNTRLPALLGRPWLCAASVLLLLLVVIRPVPLVRPFTGWPPPGWRLVVCDVGQGDALVLATGSARSAVVVDAGPDPAAVDRCLETLGVSSVPLLVLTHFHADHVAGLPGVLKGRRVGAIQTTRLEEPRGQAEFVRRTARRAGVRVIGSAAGERRHVGELSWQVLWPQPPRIPRPPGSPGSGTGLEGADSLEGAEGANDASITLLFRTGGMSLLLPGDLEPSAQSGLLSAHPALPSVDVLKVAHHGSAYQDPRLLERLRPRIALISCGADNPYGHPAPRTVGALRASGALVRRTDRNGALAVTSSPDGGDSRKDGGAPAVVAERETAGEPPASRSPPAPGG